MKHKIHYQSHSPLIRLLALLFLRLGMCTHLLDRYSDCDFIQRPQEDGGVSPFVIEESCEENTPERIEAFRQNLLSADPTIDERIPESNAIDAVNRESSPQAQAFQWMIENEALDCLTPLSQVQRFVLSSFYFGTDDSSTLESQWMEPEKSECEWNFRRAIPRPERTLIRFSICLYTGELAYLDIPGGFNFKDRIIIPPELAILSNLRSFTMQDQRVPVSSPMSSVLLSLNKLTHLDLGGVNSIINFDGDMPDELAQLTDLKYLSLGNFMNGTMISEIGNLNKLTHLVLRCKLTGVIPASIGKLTNLHHLDLYNNDLDGPIPDEFSSLTKLEYLFMNSNNFDSFPPGVGGFTNLKGLSYSSNPVVGPLPTEMGALSRLEYLYMYGPPITGVYNAWDEGSAEGVLDSYLPEEWSGMTALEILSLEGQGVTGTLPASWGDGMKSLRMLHLGTNHITGTLPPEWSGMESLQRFELQNNGLTGTIPSEYNSLSDLSRFFLNFNDEMSGTIPSIRSLYKIIFEGTNITFLDGSIPSDFDGDCSTRYDFETDCYNSRPDLCFEGWCRDE